MAISREQLLATLNGLLQPERFKDYCPNGLQVEGRPEIQRLVSGVTASQALLNAAIDCQADAILVHHGYFWRSENPCLTGMKGRRIRTLMSADINLFAYHLPLDCHPELGNNAGLGRALGIEAFGPALPQNPDLPVFIGQYQTPRRQADIAMDLAQVLGREVLSEATQTGERSVTTVAWCTGGGQGYIDTAADLGADLFVTGEVSEQTIHCAREREIGFIAAGHHATERFGARSVGDYLAREWGLWHQFVDIPNPA